MDLEALKYYKIIGQLQAKISQTRNFDTALKEGLNLILNNSAADYAVMWYQNDKKGREFHPYYWICPMDFTSVTYNEGQGIVGKTHSSGSAICVSTDDKKGFDEDFKLLEELKPSSLLCVPFDSQYNGCILFVKTKEKFTEEESDVCQILATMAEVSINEGKYEEDEWQKGNVIISARGITKEYRNGEIVTKVLKGVNLDVFDGEFLVLLGESGCGKSTFLNIIGGMDQADGGSFTFMGRDMTKATQEELTKYRRDNIGFIFQNYNLMPNLNARQNLDLIAELVDEPMDTEEALRIVGLSEKKNNYPSQMSGGQQQRVSIARALVKKPKMIFADEPTAALDYETSIEVLTALENVIANGTTLVMVTHNEEITRMANRVVRFRDGKTYEITVNKKPCRATELVW